MTTAQLVPALLVPLVLWRLYRRIRRSFGRQPLHRSRLVFAAVFFSVITGLVALGSLRVSPALLSLGGGLALGVPLGLLGLRLTLFEESGGRKFYTPNPILGIGVTLVFIGRLVYRITVMATTPPAEAVRASMLQSPLTLGLFGLTAGYYITYYLGVLRRDRPMPLPIA